MFIHFAFGSYKEDVDKQSDLFITHILESRSLKFCQNTEFLPAIDFGGIVNDSESTSFDGQSISTYIPLDKPIVKSPGYIFLPETVYMICFIKIALNKVASSLHVKEYGRLGIVMSDDFVKHNGGNAVRYYTITSLKNDTEINEWNQLSGGQKLSDKDEQRRLQLYKSIPVFRKPSKMFKEFANKIAKVEVTKNGPEFSNKPAYDRYPEGYDFTNEREWRIASPKETQLSFNEGDVLKILVPNPFVKDKIQGYLENNWTRIPEVVVIK